MGRGLSYIGDIEQEIPMMAFELNGYRVHYGEFTGVWWVTSLTGRLLVEKFRSRDAAIAWVKAQ